MKFSHSLSLHGVALCLCSPMSCADLAFCFPEVHNKILNHLVSVYFRRTLLGPAALVNHWP